MGRRTTEPKPARRSAEPHATDDDGGRTPEVCTIDDVIARYPGEWIVMRITEYNERRLPARGVLIAHSPSRRTAQRIWGGELSRAEPGDGVLSLFDAYRRITTGEELRASLAELIAGPDPVPWPGLR
jgi:hypothetical protein